MLLKFSNILTYKEEIERRRKCFNFVFIISFKKEQRFFFFYRSDLYIAV